MKTVCIFAVMSFIAVALGQEERKDLSYTEPLTGSVLKCPPQLRVSARRGTTQIFKFQNLDFGVLVSSGGDGGIKQVGTLWQRLSAPPLAIDPYAPVGSIISQKGGDHWYADDKVFFYKPIGEAKHVISFVDESADKLRWVRLTISYPVEKEFICRPLVTILRSRWFPFLNDRAPAEK